LKQPDTWKTKESDFANLLVSVNSFTDSELEENCQNLLATVEVLIFSLAGENATKLKTHSTIVAQMIRLLALDKTWVNLVSENISLARIFKLD
jgi:hypothetical protein